MKECRHIDSITVRRNKIALFLIILIVSMQIISCKKLVEVIPPSTTINSANVYENDATAIAAITDIYVGISRQNMGSGGISSLSLFPALSSDELSLYNGATNNSVLYFYKNSLSSNNLNNPDFWTVLYQNIYTANQALEQLSLSHSITPAVKQQLLGEAKFIRAFCYFYLVNLYGDVPLTISTDYKINSLLFRSSKGQVYQQIISDLTDAQGLLSSKFLNATLLSETAERVRPTYWAATALLSRAYLYNKNYLKSESEATAVINNNLQFQIVLLDSVFYKNSYEAIWQLQPVNQGWNTEDARIFILPASGPNAYAQPVYLSAQLINSFELSDKRKEKWVGTVSTVNGTYYYPNKYRSATYNDPITEYEMVLRLSEQYLIRAEAEIMQNNFNDAKNDINKIRSRAGLPPVNGNDQASLLAAISHERQVELFTEWGQRWFDLKRTGAIDAVMNVVTPQKGGTWNANWQWYPISINELSLNPNLIQNQGY